MSHFDKKFGKTLLKGLPTTPGVYFFHDTEGALIYVGKAKNLRRRLGQYRNAKRRKKHARMRAIVAEAGELRIEPCETEMAASLLEARLIQLHRPRWNVAGAFYFLYPMVGLNWNAGILHLCYTTEPDAFPEFAFHGAYRSRHLTKDAFFALAELLAYVGHRERGRSHCRIRRYSYVLSFRQLPEDWFALWGLFLRGESRQAVEELILALVENAGARQAPRKIQEHLDAIKRFWRHEAAPLARARKTAAFEEYPVSQKERDILFLKAGHLRRGTAAGSILETSS